ncbi:MAG: hypothetical protein U0M39_07380, partial [Oscillospiraceae bacterium]|nr:hypothetical protein [Oscillospiraceae bacterium]
MMVVFTAKSQQYFHAVFDINAASWFSQSLKNLYSFLYLPHYFFSNRNREIAPTFCRGNFSLSKNYPNALVSAIIEEMGDVFMEDWRKDA